MDRRWRVAPGPEECSDVKPKWWRQWHRWIAFPSAVFLLFASVTGILTAWYEFFGEEEALREATRLLVSPMRIGSADSGWSAPMARAFATAATRFPQAPVDKVEIQFKGSQPTVTIFTGKPSGGEDKKLVLDARSGALLKVDAYTDKPLIHRIHSGEFIGDGGLVFSMLWGLSLAVLTASGFIIYLLMWRQGLQGIRKIFW